VGLPANYVQVGEEVRRISQRLSQALGVPWVAVHADIRANTGSWSSVLSGVTTALAVKRSERSICRRGAR
jgi:hypothetical protein